MFRKSFIIILFFLGLMPSGYAQQKSPARYRLITYIDYSTNARGFPEYRPPFQIKPEIWRYIQLEFKLESRPKLSTSMLIARYVQANIYYWTGDHIEIIPWWYVRQTSDCLQCSNWIPIWIGWPGLESWWIEIITGSDEIMSILKKMKV